MTHLDALELRLSNERIRLASAKTSKERELRKVWIDQIEKEIEGEKKFLLTKLVDAMTDEEVIETLEKLSQYQPPGEQKWNSRSKNGR